MQKLNKIFTQTNMSWKLVAVLTLACGVIPSLLMVPECLSGTSLQSPGINFEFWVFIGLFIALNCEKPLEAGVKVFVFFLISQPLIYLVQVPFSSLGWQLFGYYPRWALITLFTFPAGMLANLIKRDSDKWWSVLILLIPMAILALELPTMSQAMLVSFPKMTLAVVFIVAQLVLFPLILLQNKRRLAATYALIVVMLIASSASYMLSSSSSVSASIGVEGVEPYDLADSEVDGVSVTIENDMITVKYSALKGGDAFSVPIEYKDGAGDTYTLTFTKTATDTGAFSEIEKE